MGMPREAIWAIRLRERWRPACMPEEEEEVREGSCRRPFHPMVVRGFST
jgi:hypothetical protein